MKYSIAPVLLFLALLFATPHLAAQQDQKLRLAQSYEESGDFANASRLYMELYEENKNAAVYFDGVRRTLLQQNKFSDLLPIVEERLAKQKTPDLYALLGNLHWKTGKTSSADEAWDNAIDRDPTSEQPYALVAQAQIDNRLFDKAIVTLHKGRKATDNPVLFANELSQLYGTVNKYSEGTREVINYLRVSKNIAVAQGRLSAYLINDQGIAATKKELAAIVDASKSDMYIVQLYAWFLREVKDYDKALEIHKMIDDMTKSEGREILAFADVARREGYYEPALRAYTMIIEKGNGNPYAMTALFGYARAVELRSKSGAEFSREEAEKVIKLYRKIIDDYPNTQFAAESYFNIASLYSKELDNIDDAIDEYNKLLATYGKTEIAATGGVQLGLLYLRRNEIDRARETFSTVVSRYGSIVGPRDEALFHLARLAYYDGQIDSAKEQFGRLAANTNNDIANDALTMIALLEDNKDEEVQPALKEYAKAELKEIQQNYDEAVDLFGKAAAAAPAAPLAERSYFRMGKIELDRRNYNSARAHLTNLISKYPTTIYGDRATMYIGDSYAAEKNTEEAMKTYTKLLEKYPRSTLLSEARLKIRKLRGDA